MNDREVAVTAPEPLTLVELVRHLGEHDYWLGYDSSGMYIAMPVDGNSPAVCGTGSTPWDAANDAMPGRRVAPRDEAAELRAENERLRADLFEYVLDGFVQGAHRQEDGGYHTGGVSTYRDLGNWLVEHAHWTRRPGGRGRNQVYDPPKADAASGGQP